MTEPALTHLFVLVSDLARSKAFYESIGLEVLLDEGGYVRLGGGGGFHIGMEEGLPDRVGGRGIAIEIRVDDVDALYERLSGSGVPFRSAPEDMLWGARHAFLPDPDGYPVSIYSSIP